jgi:glycosyltransferase involved in cell wall biosynthesis
MSGKGAHVLILLSDAYGGFGGISQYNRDLIEALCALDEVRSVEAIPRIAHEPIGALPPKLRFDLSGRGSHVKYAAAALRRGLFGPKPDIVLCGHINLLPICHLIARIRGARLVLLIFGIDAWEPTRWKTANRRTGSVDKVVSISQVTLDRYLDWARPPRSGTGLLPNAIHLEDYAMAPKAPDLVEKFGLAGRKVLMTFGRLAGRERAKGFDRIIELMPRILEAEPAAIYVVAGTGDDIERLQQKTRDLGVAEHVVFTGLVPEERKADYFRLADVYVMPSRGEGFGFVFLEAMACGIPVIASRADGGFEAIREGELGVAVDPLDNDAICRAIYECLGKNREIPDGLSYFAFPNFVSRTRDIFFGA